MRANPSCSMRCGAAALAGLLAAGMTVSADIGGGSGRIITPYRPGSVVTAQEVETVKKASASSRRISNLPLASGARALSGSGVGLSYVAGTDVGKPAFEISGVTENGAARTVDFSLLDTVWVAKIENNLLASDRVQLHLKLFPTISIQQLLSDKPTYTRLRDAHEETIRLWVPLTQSRSELALVATTDEGYRELAKVRDLKPDTPIAIEWGLFELNGRRWPSIWWATEAVTKDPAYPHVAIARR
jgi:hypothetical protein